MQADRNARNIAFPPFLHWSSPLTNSFSSPFSHTPSFQGCFLWMFRVYVSGIVFRGKWETHPKKFNGESHKEEGEKEEGEKEEEGVEEGKSSFSVWSFSRAVRGEWKRWANVSLSPLISMTIGSELRQGVMWFREKVCIWLWKKTSELFTNPQECLVNLMEVRRKLQQTRSVSFFA